MNMLIPMLLLVLQSEEPVERIAIQPNAHYSTGPVRLWNGKGKPVRTFGRFKADDHRYMAVSADGRVLSVSGGMRVQLWDLSSGKSIRRLDLHAGPTALSEDGKRLAVARRDKGEGYPWVIDLIEVDTGKVTRTLRGHRYRISALCFSSDGKRILSGGHQSARLWDANDGKPLWTLEEKRSIASVAFMPDGKTFAASGKGGIRVWDIPADGEPELRWKASDGQGYWSAFSADRKHLVMYGMPRLYVWAIRVFDVGSGKELSEVEVEEKNIRMLVGADGLFYRAGVYDPKKERIRFLHVLD